MYRRELSAGCPRPANNEQTQAHGSAPARINDRSNLTTRLAKAFTSFFWLLTSCSGSFGAGLGQGNPHKSDSAFLPALG
jgi:hypothetical protein